MIRRVALCLTAACLLAASNLYAAPIFNFNFTSGNAQSMAGFQAAANRWSVLFADNVTINIDAGFTALGAGILGSASSTNGTVAYTGGRAALVADATSLDDVVATANLPVAPNMRLYINRTSDNPNGSGSATPYVDTTGENTSTLRINYANARALGLAPAIDAVVDASITFSTSFAWDFDPTDGITAGAYDFVGVATHEIGHALGFVSGVDILDINSPPVNGPFPSNAFTYVNTLDLYRYSTDSDTNNALDWTADTRAKYFSIDGGTSAIANFALGKNFGDGQQASHWKDNLGIGVMDPTAASGELLSISSNDIRAMDVIGWNLSTAVPSPGTLLLLTTGLAGLLFKRRQKSGR